MKNIDWSTVQSFYDEGNTWRDIKTHFNLCDAAIAKAVKNGKLRCRSRSAAAILDQRKKPRTHTNETKRKISMGRKKYLWEHPDQVPYLLNHYSKGESYPEKYFHRILQKTDLNYERYLQISLYNLDFAFMGRKIDLEIDGEQHYVDDRIYQSNILRDVYLQNLGWNIIRVRWSEFKKLNKEGRKKFVHQLFIKLNNKDIIVGRL